MKDRLLGLAVVLLAFALYWFGRDLAAPISYEPVGPRAFPMLLAGLLGLTGAWLLVLPSSTAQAPSGASAEPPDPTEPAQPPEPRILGIRIVLALVAVACYAGLFERLGFIVATAAMTIAVGRLFGGGWLACVLAGLGMGAGFFVLFDKVLDVVLPLGLLGGGS